MTTPVVFQKECKERRAERKKVKRKKICKKEKKKSKEEEKAIWPEGVKSKFSAGLPFIYRGRKIIEG